uniref:Uncharacterized protein LOC111099849 isoform X1 n=2 Tax=Crassostrea virginica TaxID=6565 RepID=A0A8B8A8U5_CRAVI|nr:uncharacterized protein LOC111099849 isoform X1 [Crassostrea virginica]XP_022287023.1 uncharacterized protein LOC111099849 isoform X1 [Crassostrea virginica]XP_022287024.1 uncharacterized protein LOC111099849 isoform X1 [Crassostrea virginica]XP_022287436.1 uncharacterized protein LOC111100117 isoform X1 [Crassostrea virginica]XP_022287437.1 uncharacterized protein LOC111100117 isoform X1 [Crassostrea virginica]XP_022287438.1 uncharacterized protein LOC111100117 isoform X1 [Crassostrea virg
MDEDLKVIISYYHAMGLSYKEITAVLRMRHNQHYSYEYLKRKIIPKLNLNNRRGPEKLTDFDVVLHTIQNEMIQKPDRSISDMFFRLKGIYGYIVRRKLVREIMQTLDPKGISDRKGNKLKRRQYISKGPNWIWHIDQYDKLSPFGIHISGCIDGFSRFVLWCEAGVSNKDPKKIASYFVKALEQAGGYPHIVRGDAGTENGIVAAMQNFLREDEEDSFSKKAFIYGKSTHNQRIERWWGILRTKCTDRWIHLFKELEKDGHFSVGNKLHVALVQYCFMNIIRTELEEVKCAWNVHRIRQQNTGDVIPGIPDLLYHVPEMLENPQCRNFIHPMETTSETFQFLQDQCNSDNDLDEDLTEALDVTCGNYKPVSVDQARALYIWLKDELEQILYN